MERLVVKLLYSIGVTMLIVGLVLTPSGNAFGDGGIGSGGGGTPLKCEASCDASGSNGCTANDFLQTCQNNNSAFCNNSSSDCTGCVCKWQSAGKCKCMLP